MLTNRQKVLVAGAGSALLHAVLLVGVGLIVALRPPETPPAAPPAPLHLEIVKSEPELSMPPAPAPEHRVVDNSMMKDAEHPRTDSRLEGDKTTVAASEVPGTGDEPLPTQKGRVAPNYAFNPAPPAPAEPPPAEPPPAEPPPSTPPPPAPQRPLAQDHSDDPAPTLVRNDLALVDAQPSPPPEEVNPYDPSFRSTAPPPPVPVRRSKPASAYHPLEEQTASSGSITIHGASSVDAVATPFGRYRKAVTDSIRSIWRDEVEARSDIASLGAIKVHFALDRTGHIHMLRVLSNSSNSALESITLDAITRAAIPPIPPEVVESLGGAMLQLDVTFECL